MTNKYILLVVKPSNPRIPEVMHTSTQYCTAEEENKHLLLAMGQSLMDDGLIISYQLAKLEGYPTIAY